MPVSTPASLVFQLTGSSWCCWCWWCVSSCTVHCSEPPPGPNTQVHPHSVIYNQAGFIIVLKCPMVDFTSSENERNNLNWFLSDHWKSVGVAAQAPAVRVSEEDVVPVIICASEERMGASMATINSVFHNTDASVFFYIVTLRDAVKLTRFVTWLEACRRFMFYTVNVLNL